MKIKSGFVLREIADQYMAVAVGERAREMNGLFGMNETAAFLWKKLENNISIKDLSLALLEEYELDEKEAIKTVESFVEMLDSEGVLDYV